MPSRKKYRPRLRPKPVQLEPGPDLSQVLARLAGTGHDRRKTLQLCKQTHRALDAALGGVCGDPVLQSLHVLQVLPAPDQGHLLVILQPSRDASPSAVDVLARLEQVRGLLRSEVADAITRKRVPELSYQLLAP